MTQNHVPEPLPTQARARIMAVLRLALPVIILFSLWQIADGPEVLRRLAGADWRWLAAAFVMANLQIVISALRWRLTAAQLEQPFGKGHAVREYYLSQLLNHTLPSGVLGDAGRAVRQRHQAGMIRAGQAVLIERMAGQIALFLVMFGGFIFLRTVPTSLRMPVWVSELATWMAGGILGFIVLVFALRYLPGIASRAATGFVSASRQALFTRKVWFRQLVFSLLTVACNLASLAFCAYATGTDIPFIAIVTVIPLILAAMLIPLSIGGWGLREGAAAALWPMLGAPAEAGIAASIAFGIVILAASFPGIWVLIRQMRP